MPLQDLSQTQQLGLPPCDLEGRECLLQECECDLRRIRARALVLGAPAMPGTTTDAWHDSSASHSHSCTSKGSTFKYTDRRDPEAMSNAPSRKSSSLAVVGI